MRNHLWKKFKSWVISSQLRLEFKVMQDLLKFILIKTFFHNILQCCLNDLFDFIIVRKIIFNAVNSNWKHSLSSSIVIPTSWVIGRSLLWFDKSFIKKRIGALKQQFWNDSQAKCFIRITWGLIAKKLDSKFGLGRMFNLTIFRLEFLIECLGYFPRCD